MVLIQQKENLQVTFTKADTRKVKGMAIIMMVLHHSFMMPERYKGYALCGRAVQLDLLVL